MRWERIRWIRQKANHAENEQFERKRILKKWVKRIVFALSSLAVLLAVALYVLWFRRASLPAAATRARLAPIFTPVSGLSACWIETASSFASFPFGATAGTILVRHPSG